MKRKLSREAKIGLFGIIILGLFYLGINFIKSKNIFSRDNTFYAVYNQADGIEVSSPVVIKGFRVGTVDKVSFDISNSTVIVEMSVKDEYPIPADSKAKISSTSLLGGKVLEIQLGNSVTDYKSGDTITTLMDPSIMEIAGQEYEKLKYMASTLIEQVSKALASVNEVLSAENVENLRATLAHIESISAGLDDVLVSQNSNLKTTITNLSALSASLNRAAPGLENGIAKFSLLADSLSVTVPDISRNAAVALENLNSTLRKIDQGEGSVGKLVNDKELYENLNAATQSLNELLVDLKANPKKYINVTIFGKKEKKPTVAATLTPALPVTAN